MFKATNFLSKFLLFLLAVLSLVGFLFIAKSAHAQVSSCAGQSAGTWCLYGGLYYGGPNKTNTATCNTENNLWTCNGSGSCNTPGPVHVHGPDPSCKICPKYGENYKLWCTGGVWKESYDTGSCSIQTNTLETCELGCGANWTTDRCKAAPTPTNTPKPPTSVPPTNPPYNPPPTYPPYNPPTNIPPPNATSTPNPTATPKPTGTPTPVPTATPTNAPTATPTTVPTATPKPTATSTPIPTATPTATPTLTPTPYPFDESMCKCDQLDFSSISLGTPLKITAFGRVEGENTNYAKIPTMTFTFYQGNGTIVNIIDKATIPTTIVEDTPTKVRYQAIWDLNLPLSLDTSQTYRIQAKPDCSRKTAAIFNAYPTRVVLATKDAKPVSLWDRIVSFFTGFFGGGQQNVQNVAGQPTPTPTLTAAQLKQLQLKTFTPAQGVSTDNCSFIKFNF